MHSSSTNKSHHLEEKASPAPKMPSTFSNACTYEEKTPSSPEMEPSSSSLTVSPPSYYSIEAPPAYQPNAPVPPEIKEINDIKQQIEDNADLSCASSNSAEIIYFNDQEKSVPATIAAMYNLIILNNNRYSVDVTIAKNLLKSIQQEAAEQHG